MDAFEDTMVDPELKSLQPQACVGRDQPAVLDYAAPSASQKPRWLHRRWALTWLDILVVGLLLASLLYLFRPAVSIP